MLVMVVFFIAFRWIHLSTPLIRLFLLVLILLLMPTLNFLPVWFALSLLQDVFRSGDSSKKFKIAEGQWYRYAPSYVSPAYHLLEGFPFIQEPPSGDLQERVLIRHHD